MSDTACHHYAYTRAGGRHKLFVAGILVADKAYAGRPGSTAGLPLVIGALKTEVSPSGFREHFGGVIDEVQVYNRALSDDEITALYDATKPNAELAVTARASYKSNQRLVVVTVAVGN